MGNVECLLNDMLHQKGMSKAELARMTGYSREAISKIANGKWPDPGIVTCYAISEALGLELGDIWKYHKSE